MTRIAATLLGAIMGYAAGTIADACLAIDWGAWLGSALWAAVAWIHSRASGEGYNRNDRAIMSDSMDKALIVAWGAGPALADLMPHKGRYSTAEGYMFEVALPIEVRELVPTMPDFMLLLGESIRVGTEPLAAIKRHNRKHRPRIGKKDSESYDLLRGIARILILAGADRRGARWFYHVAERLKVDSTKAAVVLRQAFDQEAASLLMIPSHPKEGSRLADADKAIGRSDAVEAQMEDFDRQRESIINMMFGSRDQAA